MYLAICDDEVSQLTQITGILETYREKRLPSLQWSTFQTGFSLLSAMEQGQFFDGVLLDICMTDMNGMDAARSIRTLNDSIPIIFLTSSPDYAVESYRVEAFDYLLKPVTQPMLFQMLDRLLRRTEMSEMDSIIVRNKDGSITKVLLNRVMYLEAMGHYGVLYHADGSCTKTTLSFSSLLKQLAVHSHFVQIHRSYMVNLHYVHRIDKNTIILLNGTVLPLPRSRYREVAACFQNILFEEVE